MAGRRSNGEGSVVYDKRRKNPYRARVTIGWEIDEKTGKSKQIIKNLGSFKTKGAANAALAEYLKRPFDLDNKDITFSQLYERWFKDFIKDDSESQKYRFKAAYKYCSSVFNKKFKDITILDMKDCIYKGFVIPTRGKNKGQKQYASPTTKENIKSLFNRMYAYAVEARIVDRNYARDFYLDKKVGKEKIENRKVKVPFSDEELSKLWRSMEFVPFADMIVYACYSGWRPIELVSLKVKDVDLDSGFIKGGVKTKSGKNRVVPIHPSVRPIIQKYYDEAISVGSEYLFNDLSKKQGIGLSYDQYLSRFNHVIETLNFRKEITPHYTRHTFITKAKSRKVNMNEYILKLITGHKIMDITESVYTHRTLEDLKEEMDKIQVVTEVKNRPEEGSVSSFV